MPKTDRMKKKIAIDAKQKTLEQEEYAINEAKMHTEQMLSFAEQKYREEIKYLKLELKRITVDKGSLSEQIEHCVIRTNKAGRLKTNISY